MTDEQCQKITNLRTAGNGYNKISKLLGLSENTVKSFCRRKKLGGVVVKNNEEVVVCKGCEKTKDFMVYDYASISSETREHVGTPKSYLSIYNTHYYIY